MNAVIDSAKTAMNCPLCGEPLPENAKQCTKCDWVRGYEENAGLRDRVDRRDIAAALLSVVPGAGHLLKGHIYVGAALLMAVPVILLMAFTFTMFFGWLLIPVYWMGVAFDAYLRPDLRGLGGLPPAPVAPVDPDRE